MWCRRRRWWWSWIQRRRIGARAETMDGIRAEILGLIVIFSCTAAVVSNDQ
jgi:hypothetical protein